MTETRDQSSLAGMSRRAVESLGDTVASLPPREATLVKMPELEPELAGGAAQDGRFEVVFAPAGGLRAGSGWGERRGGDGDGQREVACATRSRLFRTLWTGRAGARSSCIRRRRWPRISSARSKRFGLRGVHPATYDGDTPARPSRRHQAQGEHPAHEPGHAEHRHPAQPRGLGRLSCGIWRSWPSTRRTCCAASSARTSPRCCGGCRRVAMLHGGDPRFVLTSATIANPQELAESLTGLPFQPRGQRRRLHGRAARRLPQSSAAGQGEGGEAEPADRGGPRLRQPGLAGREDHRFRQDPGSLRSSSTATPRTGSASMGRVGSRPTARATRPGNDGR